MIFQWPDWTAFPVGSGQTSYRFRFASIRGLVDSGLAVPHFLQIQLRTDEAIARSVYNFDRRLFGCSLAASTNAPEKVVFVPMPRTRIVGLNEEQLIHALSIDDAYHVERTLVGSHGKGVTERVTMEGSGPFVRKKIPLNLANRAVWAVLQECDSLRLPRVALTYELPDCFVAVYDFVPGNTLESLVAARGRLPVDEAVQAVQDVCEALADMHAHGMVHCDVAPANVIIAADGAHLIDFGIAKFEFQKSSDDVARFGTWGFAAPEQYGFAPADVRSDVYSVSQMLGYLLTGVSPEPGSKAFSQAIGDSQVVPADIAEIIKKGTAFEPGNRYQSIVDFSRALAVTCENIGNPGALDSRSRQDASESSDSRFQADDSSSQPRSDESLKREALESAAAHVAAQDQATLRESRVHAALKTGLLSVAVVAALSGVLILNVSTCARLAEGFGGNSAATSQGGIANGASGNAAEEDAVAEAAQAGVEEGLKRGSNLPSFESGESSNADVEAAFDALSIADSGWSVDSSGYVNYAFLLKNEEDGFRVLFPTVKITGRDASGKVLFSHEQVLPAINPGETVCYGFVAGNGTPPEDVEFVVARPDDYNISKHAAESPKFEVSAASAVPDGFGGANFTGEVAYLGGVLPGASMGGVAVTVVLRDDAGKIVYGAATHTDCPAEGESTTFEILGGKLPPYDSIEAYAQAW